MVLMSALSDDDLWEILHVAPNRFTHQPSPEWIAWAKSEVLSHNTDDYCSDYIFLPRLIRLAHFIVACSNCDILTWGTLRSIYHDAWAASGISPSDHSYAKMIRSGIHSQKILREEREVNEYNVESVRMRFSFKGRQAWFLGGQYPKSFDEIPYGLPAHLNRQPEQIQSQETNVATLSQSAANSKSISSAQATGGNAIAAPVINAAPVANTGDVQQSVTVNSHDPAGTVAATSTAIERARDKAREEGIELGRLRERVEQSKLKDNQDDGDIVPHIGGWTTRVKVAAAVGRDPKTLKNWESTGRTPDGTPWPKGEKQGSMVFYRIEEVWPSILKIVPEVDRDRQKLLYESIMELRNTDENIDD